MNCPKPPICAEREFTSVKYIVSNCNIIEVTLTQKQNTDCTTEFVSLLDADGNSYPENSEFVSVNNQISRVIIEGLSTCAADAIGGGETVAAIEANILTVSGSSWVSPTNTQSVTVKCRSGSVVVSAGAGSDSMNAGDTNSWSTHNGNALTNTVSVDGSAGEAVVLFNLVV